MTHPFQLDDVVRIMLPGWPFSDAVTRIVGLPGLGYDGGFACRGDQVWLHNYDERGKRIWQCRFLLQTQHLVLVSRGTDDDDQVPL